MANDLMQYVSEVLTFNFAYYNADLVSNFGTPYVLSRWKNRAWGGEGGNPKTQKSG